MTTPTKTSGTYFREILPHKNFMTPNVIEYLTIGIYEVELSSGNGIGGAPLFGVTVVSRATRERCLDLDRSFDNIKSAKLYINELNCNCRTYGKDDGQYTCQLHHDCRQGDCTHGE